MEKTTPLAYFRQVRSEIGKITWPSRRETTISTLAVFVMVFLAAVFLYFADQIMALVVHFILNLGV